MRESIIQSRIEELDSKFCNDVCLEQNILSEYEKLKKELQEMYEEKGRGAFSDPKLDGLKMEKSQRNFSLISREGIMKKRLSHSYKSGKENSCQISNK